MARGRRKNSSKMNPKQKAAAAKVRGADGRFLPKTAANPTPSPMESPENPSFPSPAPTEEVIQQNIGFLEAIIAQKQAMGIPTDDLEKIVLGLDKNLGVRKQLQEFVDANASKFSRDDPAGAAAQTLFSEVAGLSELSLKASRAQAVEIYKKLNFIRELTKRTQGEQSDLAKRLGEIIEPVEKQLKNQMSFREFIKEKVSDFKKKLPERLVSKIPIVGGLLSEFMKERRESREVLQKYSGQVQQDISRAGKSNYDLVFPDSGSGRTRSASSSMMEAMGGESASSIPGLLDGAGSSSMASTLGMMYEEVKGIRQLLIDRLPASPDELSSRESQLEALAGEKKDSGLGGLLKNLKGAFGKGGGGIMGMLTNIAGIKAGVSMLGAVMPALTAVLGPVAAIVGGAGAGLGIAYGINKLLDKAFGFEEGDGLADHMLRADTWDPSKIFDVEAYRTDVDTKMTEEQASAARPGISSAISSGTATAADIARAVRIGSLSEQEAEGTIKNAISEGKYDSNFLDYYKEVLKEQTLANEEGGSRLINLGKKYQELKAKYGYDAKDERGGLSNVTAIAAEMTQADGTLTTSEVNGTITSPSTPNTTLGAMTNTHNAEVTALSEASRVPPPSQTQSNTSVVNSKVNNTTNNFNDDLRIRNNEPTIKQAQQMSMVNW